MDGKSHKQYCELEGTEGRSREVALRVGSKNWRNRLPTVAVALSLPFEVPGIDISPVSSFHCLKGIMGRQLAQGDDFSIMNHAWGLDLGC